MATANKKDPMEIQALRKVEQQMLQYFELTTWKGALPSDEPRGVQEHEEGVTDVVVDVRHDVK